MGGSERAHARKRERERCICCAVKSQDYNLRDELLLETEIHRCQGSASLTLQWSVNKRAAERSLGVLPPACPQKVCKWPSFSETTLVHESLFF